MRSTPSPIRKRIAGVALVGAIAGAGVMAAAAAANAADSTPTATTSSTAASAGVYEAHLITAAGERLIVQMDATFTVTGNDTGGPSDGTRGADPTDAPSTTTAG